MDYLGRIIREVAVDTSFSTWEGRTQRRYIVAALCNLGFATKDVAAATGLVKKSAFQYRSDFRNAAGTIAMQSEIEKCTAYKRYLEDFEKL